MARNEDGSLISPIAPHSSEVITERGHAELLDVSAIARRVLAGELVQPELVFEDTTGQANSLQEALDLVERKQALFDMLPASVRLEAGHDLVTMERMLETQEGCQQLCDAGLALDGFTPSQPSAEAPGVVSPPEAPANGGEVEATSEASPQPPPAGGEA